MINRQESEFTFQPSLEGKTIRLRALREVDFFDLHHCASDEKIWEGHPSPDRYTLTEFLPYFISSLESDASIVVLDKESNKIIGLSRYYQVDKYPDDMCIGFTFLACKYWGGTTNRELKGLMIDYALQYFSTVWLHVGPSNIRSQKAVLKLGAKFVGEEELVIANKTGKWLSYRIDKALWQKHSADDKK